ncbi:AAA family ATPase [Microbacterium amylolyticum]|uniref:Energy-coupling factor transporter ATP-binding protein EcfA2 n=1 Tax=Microbacterium amylolyticum TaxID=936337 RepID=A0ABS4ZLS7_9MICO|nr:AAA family ATPase [Microbacterium amylolyticum]MBP2437910.1 energy-coupling factor transporter ATP-binding protein EcfA2 [Microbacterium amylolyticum]
MARWKRGIGGAGVASAAAYAFGGACDSSHDHSADHTTSTIAAARYAGSTVTRHTVTDEGISRDDLNVDQLQTWFAGSDPKTGERRGRELTSPATDLVFDATVNSPKSYSLAAVLDPELADAYEALQDRLRDRIVTLWKEELNGRRGAAGAERMELAQVEVVELRHERSRALDAHKHRHLWLNAKVLGRDGKWSSLDSRVMLRFQNVVNAEGDLAARTDPEWIAALAEKGFTLDADGEITELAQVVRPLSRRSNQIEANRAVRLAQWRKANPGQEPGHDVLMAIDRWAWAHQRPNKPDTVDEEEWRDTVRREIADIDPALVTDGNVRPPAPVTSRAIADVDRDDLALRAVTDADNRSAGNGGRFSDFDVRAGAVRAVAAAGIVADRAALDELIEDVAARASEGSTVTLVTEPSIPGHVKHRMATRTLSAKVALADKFDRLAIAGETVEAETVNAVAAESLTDGRTLDAGQTDAAAAIGGTDRLVTVTGPAGTGKTTMLRVARQLLENQGRKMVIVAPTKKAATVAGQETGATASSLHALLHDHGFRWTDTPAGQQWTRLVAGQDDPVTGRVYEGPTKFPLNQGDRIVVDEAGMVDLHTANALADVAAESGAGLAMVGDHLQALPVGHSGAMSLMRSRSTAAVELTAVHRFRTEDGEPDTAWADLSLRVREPGENAEKIAAEIVATGHCVAVSGETEARAHMVDEWLSGHAAGQRVSLVTATHDEAQAISEAIQARRLEHGHLDTDRTAVLQSGQVAYTGDIVQTRRNDQNAGVENRQVWTISDINDSGTVTLTSIEDAGMTRQVDTAYLSEHAHLAYASTVHGVQGETTDRALVGPGVDAAGLYVGLTRGRTHNAAVVIADNDRAAREQLVDAMQRGQIEATIDDSRAAARLDLARAARDTHVPVDETGKTAPWHDKTARPLGHLRRIDEILTDAVDREKALHDQVTRLSETIAIDQAALDEINVKIATGEALSHGTDVDDDAARLLPARDRLMRRLSAAREERGELSREYRKITRRLELAQAEQGIRTVLGSDHAAYEDDARRRALRERYGKDVPAWNDRKARPFGRATSLRALRVATNNDLAKIDAERAERADRIAAAQQIVRTGAGPNGIPLTPEQRERITTSLEGAVAAYDTVVEKHTKLVWRMRGIDRELAFREQLSTSTAAITQRVSTIQTMLEMGVDEEGVTLSERDRQRLARELETATTTVDRAAAEDAARRAATDDHAAAPAGDPRNRDRGPSLG